MILFNRDCQLNETSSVFILYLNLDRSGVLSLQEWSDFSSGAQSFDRYFACDVSMITVPLRANIRTEFVKDSPSKLTVWLFSCTAKWIAGI